MYNYFYSSSASPNSVPDTKPAGSPVKFCKASTIGPMLPIIIFGRPCQEARDGDRSNVLATEE